MAKNNKHFKSPRQKAFTSPGSLVYIGKEVSSPAKIKTVEYNRDFLEEKELKHQGDYKPRLTPDRVLWLDVDGVHDVQAAEFTGRKFNLHPLLLEDVLNTTQKPKMEIFEDENQIFVVIKTLKLDRINWDVEAEQVSFVLGENFLISFQERGSLNVFDQMKDRLRRENSRTRKFGADYLLYVLMDLVVDNYYLILDQLGEKLEELESLIFSNPLPRHQNELYALKREVAVMKKAVLPLRDILNNLIREESRLVTREVNVYFRDVQDHVLQTIETLDSYREISESIMNNYHAMLSNRMNSVMKTLTVFTVIFMPLTFIAGIYGMNFDHMPELHQPNGYFYTLGFMVVLTIALWFYFKWKRYI